MEGPAAPPASGDERTLPVSHDPRLSVGTAEVSAWLLAHGLDKYTAPLLASGYDRLVLLRGMDAAEMEEVIVDNKMPRPHARSFRNGIRELRGEGGSQATPDPYAALGETVEVQPAPPVAASVTALEPQAADSEDSTAQQWLTAFAGVSHEEDSAAQMRERLAEKKKEKEAQETEDVAAQMRALSAIASDVFVIDDDFKAVITVRTVTGAKYAIPGLNGSSRISHVKTQLEQQQVRGHAFSPADHWLYAIRFHWEHESLCVLTPWCH